MNKLATVPLWFWYLFSVAYCYIVWNPYYSMWDMARSDVDPAIKAIAVITAVIVGAMYLVEGHRSLNTLGIILFLGLTGAIMWLAFNQGARFAYANWWGQWVVGALLTLALQGGRIYRSLTGRVPVSQLDSDHHGHHG